VAWPTKEEVARYSVIVLITVVVLTTFIFLLDYAFAKGVFFLYD
jgi:preprotein translocase subunit SecE